MADVAVRYSRRPVERRSLFPAREVGQWCDPAAGLRYDRSVGAEALRVLLALAVVSLVTTGWVPCSPELPPTTLSSPVGDLGTAR